MRTDPAPPTSVAAQNDGATGRVVYNAYLACA